LAVRDYSERGLRPKGRASRSPWRPRRRAHRRPPSRHPRDDP